MVVFVGWSILRSLKQRQMGGHLRTLNQKETNTCEKENITKQTPKHPLPISCYLRRRSSERTEGFSLGDSYWNEVMGEWYFKAILKVRMFQKHPKTIKIFSLKPRILQILPRLSFVCSHGTNAAWPETPSRHRS